jgi:uncharacterized protein
MKPINVIKILTFVILVGYVLGLPAQARGLDCAKAKSKVERLICDEKKNPDLYSLDSQLNTFYVEAIQNAENTQRVIEDQKKWIKAVRNVCGDADCLKNVYQARVGELQQSSTLCTSREVVIYSCTLPQRKIVSLCASQDASPVAGYMQYRMGRKQIALEMEFPKKKELAKDHFKFHEELTETSHTVWFWVKESRFTIFIKRDAHSSDDYGLIESRGHPPIRVSYSKCVREPVVFLEYQNSLPISFFTLDKRLDLPDVGDDLRLIGGVIDLEPGDLDPW